MMPATCWAKSVGVDAFGSTASTVADVVAGVFNFDFRAFRPPPSARFADTFSVEPVQAAVQASSTDGRNALICRTLLASLTDCRSGGWGFEPLELAANASQELASCEAFSFAGQELRRSSPLAEC